jgi:hypothetical protein
MLCRLYIVPHMTTDDSGGHTSKSLRTRADEARAKADEMPKGDAETMMREVARMYDQMAALAAAKEAKKKGG